MLSPQGERDFRIANFTQAQSRWPAYATQARAPGVNSMMGILLFTDDEDLGGLNCAFTENSETAARLLASHAAIAFSTARTHAHMEKGIVTRHLIGQARGVLMGSRHLTGTGFRRPAPLLHSRQTPNSATSPASSANEAASPE